jgi:hypothetical protein
MLLHVVTIRRERFPGMVVLSVSGGAVGVLCFLCGYGWTQRAATSM